MRDLLRFNQFFNVYIQSENIEPEEEMFSTTLHLMLAAVTRYAVGLVYIPEGGFDAEKELEKQKEALLIRYKTV